MKTKRKHYKFDRYIFEILLAMEVIMSFTFLGYIHIPPISITTAYIPIVVSASLFGPVESTVTGMLFGLGSMYKASASYVMSVDRIFSPFRSGFPAESILLSVGTRALFGFLVGCIFHVVKKQKNCRIWKGVCALAAPFLHSLIVYGAMGIFFPQCGFSYRNAFRLGKNNIAVMIACFVFVMFMDQIFSSSRIGEYREAVDASADNPYRSAKIGLPMFVVGAFVISMAVLSTVYFSDRMSYMLNVYEVAVSDAMERDILHLQIQFLVAVLALNFVLLILIQIIYRYMKYREYQGEMDFLTGVMGRRLFLGHYTKLQAEKEDDPGSRGWFLFLDVDYFKQINDSLGHLTGDETLKKIAETLRDLFTDIGSIGRVGGDEFAVIVEKETEKEELEKRLERFLEAISGILPERKVSCSIGVYHFMFSMEIKEVLTKTDEALYAAKERGRACFVIAEAEE